MCIHIYGSWLAISSSKSMNNVKPDCCKVVGFFFLPPSPKTQYIQEVLTLLKIAFPFMIFKCLLLFWSGGVGLLGFAKWKYCTGSTILTLGACFPRQRPNYWYQGGEGGWQAEVGIRRGKKLEPRADRTAVDPSQPLVPKSPQQWPWLDRPPV